jgi:site-specific DNA-methyltransferase (adenine-specific)
MIYYSDDFIELHHGSCLDIQEWLGADVMVSDPPYGMDFRSGQRADRFDKIAGDDTPDLRDAALDRWGGKPYAVFGTWRIPRPTTTQQVLVWFKKGAGPGMGDLELAFGTCHEEIYLRGRWERRSGKRQGSVIVTESSPSALTSKVGHPTPKPLYLMETPIRAAPEGVIAEPFAGSGSTLLAAKKLGRKAIGVELDERYCEIAARRLSNDTQIGFDFGGN